MNSHARWLRHILAKITPHYLCEDNYVMAVRTQLRNILAKTDCFAVFLRRPTLHSLSAKFTYKLCTRILSSEKIVSENCKYDANVTNKYENLNIAAIFDKI